MEIQYLSYFYAVAQAGSFNEASKKLRISQPSVSRSVQKLEELLGKKLLERKSYGVELTSEGIRVLRHTQKIFNEWSQIKEKDFAPEKSLRISASDNLCLHVLPNALAKLTNEGLLKNSNVEVFAGVAAQVFSQVLDGKSDIGLCFHTSSLPGLQSQNVGSVRFELVISPKLFASTKSSDLSRYKFIGSRAQDYLGPSAGKSMLASLGLNPKATYHCNNQETQIALAVSGVGFALAPEFAVRARIKEGKLRVVNVKKKLETPLFCISKVGATQDRNKDALLSEISKVIGY